MDCQKAFDLVDVVRNGLCLNGIVCLTRLSRHYSIFKALQYINDSVQACLRFKGLLQISSIVVGLRLKSPSLLSFQK